MRIDKYDKLLWALTLPCPESADIVFIRPPRTVNRFSIKHAWKECNRYWSSVVWTRFLFVFSNCLLFAINTLNLLLISLSLRWNPFPKSHNANRQLNEKTTNVNNNWPNHNSAWYRIKTNNGNLLYSDEPHEAFNTFTLHSPHITNGLHTNYSTYT